MKGFQLWANLPASQKMMDPRYRDIKSTQIPAVKLDNGIEIKIVCGKVGQTQGPVSDIVIEPEYLDLTLPPYSSYEHPTQPGHTVFAYVIEGEGYFCEERRPFAYQVEGRNYFDMQIEPLLGNESLVLFEGGEKVFVATEGEPVRFLLISGRPIGEPIAWYGPIVMNTQEELRTAFDEFEKGTFVKHGKR